MLLFVDCCLWYAELVCGLLLLLIVCCCLVVVVVRCL